MSDPFFSIAVLKRIYSCEGCFIVHERETRWIRSSIRGFVQGKSTRCSEIDLTVAQMRGTYLLIKLWSGRQHQPRAHFHKTRDARNGRHMEPRRFFWLGCSRWRRKSSMNHAHGRYLSRTIVHYVFLSLRAEIYASSKKYSSQALWPETVYDDN